MNHDIAVGPVIARDRCGDTEDGLREGAEVGADRIGAIAGRGRIEIRYGAAVPAVRGVNDNRAVFVHNPDFRPQIGGDSFELRVGALERQRLAVVDTRVGGGNQIRLVVERARATLNQITLRETRGERRDREKARDAKEQITEQKF